MFDIQIRDAVTIVTVVGNLDRSCSELRGAVAGMTPAGAERLVISLERCTFCDASGLEMLVHAHKAMETMLFVVLPAGAKCRRVFDVTGLSKLLRLVPTVDAALALGRIAA